MSFTGPRGRYALGDPLPDVIESDLARAFRVDAEAQVARLEREGLHDDAEDFRRRHDGAIDTWWVEAIPPTRFHAFIKAWGVSVINLRDVAGMEPAKLRFVGAQYEFLILARNPDIPGPLAPDSTIGGFLTPPNVVKQFSFGSWRDQAGRDAAARTICEGAVASIVYHGDTPEDDAGVYIGKGELITAYVDLLGVRAWWESLIDNTVEHVMTGTHAHGSHS